MALSQGSAGLSVEKSDAKTENDVAVVGISGLIWGTTWDDEQVLAKFVWSMYVTDDSEMPPVGQLRNSEPYLSATEEKVVDPAAVNHF